MYYRHVFHAAIGCDRVRNAGLSLYTSSDRQAWVVDVGANSGLTGWLRFVKYVPGPIPGDRINRADFHRSASLFKGFARYAGCACECGLVEIVAAAGTVNCEVVEIPIQTPPVRKERRLSVRRNRYSSR